MDTITLKDDYTLLVSDTTGDVSYGPKGHGMYLHDTRYLSCLELQVNGQKPEALSFTADYNIATTFRLSATYWAQLQVNDPALESSSAMVSNAVGIARRRYIRRGLIESLEFTNYHSAPVNINVALRLVVSSSSWLTGSPLFGFNRASKKSAPVGPLSGPTLACRVGTVPPNTARLGACYCRRCDVRRYHLRLALPEPLD